MRFRFPLRFYASSLAISLCLTAMIIVGASAKKRSLQAFMRPSLLSPPASGITVNSTADASPSVSGDGQCTLREAINNANSDTDTSGGDCAAGNGADIISFNIPTSDSGYSGGVFTIRPSGSTLPDITSTITIDGTSQTTFTGNTNANGPEIVLNGSHLSSGGCFAIVNGGNNTVIKGLVINGFDYGIGTGGAFGVQILDNYIGTSADGTSAVPNVYTGLSVHSLFNSTISNNLISGNNGEGIQICDASQNTYTNNRIGTDRTGANNLGNGQHGIHMICTGAGNNTFQDNIVAFNGGDGVRDEPDYRFSSNGHNGNRFFRNSFFSNGGLGINLLPSPFGYVDGVTPNDDKDGDAGSNALQNFPALTLAESRNGVNTIQGTLNSTPGQTFTIDFYASPSCNAASPSDYGEGKTYLGSTTTSATDVDGNVSFTFNPTSLASGQAITATAADSNNNTSEFSKCITSVGPGQLQFAQANTNDTETDSGSHIVNIAVKRTGGAVGAVSVDYTVTDGTATTADNDYLISPSSGTLTWNDGDASDKSVAITINGDTNLEAFETINLTLSNPTGGATIGSTNPATLTIIDDDRPMLSINDVVQAEGDLGQTAYTFTVTKSGNALPCSVSFATEDGTASASSGDYQSANGTLNFDANETMKTITVEVNGDTLYEQNETFFVNLSNPSGANLSDSQGLGTITNDDPEPPAVLGNYADKSVGIGGNTTVSPAASPSNTARMDVSTSANFKGTLTVNPSSGIVTVTNAQPAGTYTVTVKAYNTTGAATTKSFTLTVQPGAVSCVLPPFTSGATLSGVSYPSRIAVGDFNGDGHQDLVSGNFGSNYVSIRLGDGAGGFTTKPNVPTGSATSGVAVGDFNNDGKQDVVASNINSGTVSVRLGDGAGNFSGTTEVNVGSTPYSVAVGDFNGDGKQDFAAANINSGTVSIRLGDGAGNFSGSTEVNVSGAPAYVAIGDFNNDGKQDLATANYSSSNVAIRLGDGAGGFTGTTNVFVGSPYTVALGDFNNDGKLDFAASNYSSSTVSIRSGNGAGGFTGSTDISVGSNPYAVAVGDFNNDGNQDFATANWNGGVSVRFGDGAGNFNISSELATGTGQFSLSIGDFNEDNKLDLAVVNQQFQNLFIKLNGCTPPPVLGNYPNATVNLGGATTITPDAAPINTTSIAAATSTNFKGTFAVNPTTGVVRVTNAHPAGTYTVTVSAYGAGSRRNKSFTLTVQNSVASCGAPVFTNAQTLSGFTYPTKVAVGDFNGDGNQDLALANAGTSNFSVRLGNGSGGFTNKPDVPTSGTTYSVAVGDFNGDGKQDVAAANANTNTVSVRLGDGAGNFSGSTEVGVGNLPYSVAVGDFNGDGRQDIAVANANSATVSIRLGDGMGNFSGSTEVSVGGTPLFVAVGDFNNDGKQDIAAACFNSVAISIRLGDGAGGFTGTTNVSVGSNPYAVAIGDFNNDGKQDLAATAYSTNKVSIRLGDGAGNFSGTTEIGVGINPISIAVGDFNNDGNQDFVAGAAGNTGQNSPVSIRFGDGAGGFNGTTDLIVGYFPFGIAVGDFNGDSRLDFITANQGANNASVRLGGCAGQIQFAQANTDSTETNSGTHDVQIAVNRVNGSAGAVSVDYSVTNETATTADDDYSVSSATGTLTWTDGDATSRNITITVKGDTTFEANETVNLSLSNVQSATFGAQTTATLTILNDDLPPSTLVVNTTDDVDDGFCTQAHCSLREAINAANFSSDTNTINFNIPNTDPNFSGGVYTIKPGASGLPVLTERVTIDGTSQTAISDTNPNGPEILLNGSLTSGAGGISVAASNCIIKGLIINGFDYGVGLGSNIGGAQVLGNYIGTDASGTAAVANKIVGISIGASSGGTISGNLISGNGNVVNGTGGIITCDISGYTISNNLIGTDRTGTSSLGNTGMGIQTFCTTFANNTISGNIIAFNTGDGFRDQPDYFGNTSGNNHPNNRITQNSFFGNGGLGINLLPSPDGTIDGVTANDANDVDDGGNHLQNFPVITRASVIGSTRTISGTLNTTPNSSAGYTIEFFSNSSCDSSGYGEGKTYLGSVNTGTTNASGDVAFTFHPTTTFSVGDVITATATDTNGNTSEFSQCYTAVDGTPTNISLSNSSVADNSASGMSVGTFSTTDPDSSTFTYTLVDGAGSVDNSSFTITGDTLKTASLFDFETKSVYYIRVRSTDSDGAFFEKQFTVTVTDGADNVGALSLSSATYSVGEADGNATITVKRMGGADNKVIAQVGLTDVTTSSTDYGSPGTVDATFNSGSGADGSDIYAIALQADGKVVVVGNFSHFNGAARNNIIRLNADGSIDQTFNVGTGANSFLFTTAIQPDGKILIGGDFTTYNGTARNRIARLNADGTLDTSFNPGTGTDDIVYAAVLQPDGKILIGGSFTSYNGSARNRLARLNADGSLDTSFDTSIGADSLVRAISLQPDGGIIIGGQFANYSGTARNCIARLNADGTLDSSFNPGTGTDFGVLATALQSDGKIIIGGSFTTYNGASRNSVARLNTDGSLDSGFNSGAGANGLVWAITLLPDGKIMIGGGFSSYNGTFRDRLARLNADGTLDTAFNSGSAGVSTMRSIVLQSDGKLVLAGNFHGYYTIAPDRGGIVRAINQFLVTWAAGDSSDKRVQLPIVNDALHEADETLTLTLIPLTGGATTTAPSSATLTIVDNDNTAPVASDQSVSTNEDTAKSITLTGSDADNDSLTFTVTNSPQHGSLSGTAPSLTYTPADNYSGSDSFKFKVNDGRADSATDGTVSITVNPVADTPSVTNASTTINRQTTSGLIITRNGVDGTEVQFFKITNIQNGTLFKNDGGTQISNGSFITVAEGGAGLRFTPALNSNATGSFDVQGATSNTGGGLSGIATATITVTCGASNVVTNANDSGAGSLREVVSTACPGDTITFDSTVFNPAGGPYTITLTSGGLTIGKNLTITGPGANVLTVKRSAAVGTPQFRIFTIQNPATVTISGLTISNGSLASGNNGGGILNSGTLTLTNCNLFGNSVATSPTNFGGGIYNSGASLTLNNCNIGGTSAGQPNTATDGGGIYNIGGAVLMNGGSIAGNSGGGISSVFSGSITLKSVAVMNNSGGVNSLTGGVDNAPTSTATIINCLIANNSAVTAGAGLFNGGFATLINTTISGNTSAVSGGGIVNQGSVINSNTTISLTNVTITNNRSDSDNSGGEQGGGIFRSAGTVTLKNTIVAGNLRGTGTTRDDVSGALNAASSFNIIGDGTNMTGISNGSGGNQVGTSASPINAMLGALANNGGATQTHILLPGSPAINAGSNGLLPADAFDLNGNGNTSESLPFDQRGTGFNRIIGATVDIGAVEVNYSISATAGTQQTAVINTAFGTQLQATVKESNNLKSGIPVTFTAPATGASGTFSGSLTAVVNTDANGVATAPTFTANNLGGTYNVTASLGAGQPTATFALTNAKADQTITFGALSDKTFGDSDFAVSATASSGLAVSFSASGNCAVAGSSVHLTSAGSCTITASQGGDGSYNAAAVVVRSFQIAKAATATAVSSSANPSDPGQSVTFTATVTSGAGTPTGTVTFKDGGTAISACGSKSLSSGQAACTISNLTVGDHTITADYGGDSNFNVSTGALAGVQKVNVSANISINDVSLTEGDSGAKSFNFTITLSKVSNAQVQVDYATADGGVAGSSAATSPSDYSSKSGTLVFNPGDLTKSVSVEVNGDTQNEPNEIFTVNLSNAVNATISNGQGKGTILNDDSPLVQFSSSDYTISEGDPSGVATITVKRLGDTASALSVDYATSDTAGLVSCAQATGKASERCDYATTLGTLRWAAGDAAPKSFTIAIINDALVEGAEVFNVTLSNPTGGSLSAPSSATVTITDDSNDPSPQNPIDDVAFFVRQQYSDFLGRTPDPTGFKNWQDTVNQCPGGGYGLQFPDCDRVKVAMSTFQSEEFQTRGYWAYRFYEVAFGRRPSYAEFIPDMAMVGGQKSPAEEQLSKQQFINAFVQRQEFVGKYGGLGDAQQYVDALLQTAGLPNLSIRSQLISQLQSGQITRAEALRLIVETKDVEDRFYNRGFISMLYFGFLRRDPDPTGFDNHIANLANPVGDYTDKVRHIVFDFIYSTEYIGRFGRP